MNTKNFTIRTFGEKTVLNIQSNMYNEEDISAREGAVLIDKTITNIIDDIDFFCNLIGFNTHMDVSSDGKGYFIMDIKTKNANKHQSQVCATLYFKRLDKKYHLGCMHILNSDSRKTKEEDGVYDSKFFTVKEVMEGDRKRAFIHYNVKDIPHEIFISKDEIISTVRENINPLLVTLQSDIENIGA